MPNNPNEARVVRFTNIFDFDYTHAYGGVPYQLRAGETYLFPWVIGDHLATHLARQAMIRKAPIRDENDTDGRSGETKRSDRPLWDEDAIKDLKAKIITDAYVEERPAVLSEAEIMRRKVEELNNGFSVEAGQNLTSNPPMNPPSLGSTSGSNDQMTPPSSSVNTEYADKSEVLAELKKRNIPHNPRLARATLEKLLK